MKPNKWLFLLGVILSILLFLSFASAIGSEKTALIEWEKTFGGSDDDVAYSVQQTTEGGYIVAGHTKSFGAGSSNFWLIKTDSNGNMEWDKTFDSSGYGSAARSVQQTTDGGYIVAGYTYSSGTGFDFWLIKTDSNGNLEWDKTFGGSSYEHARSVQQTTDGGYIAAGYTDSFGAGSYDIWLIKTDSNGNLEWDKTFGGSNTDLAYSVQQTSDGGYIAAGYTDSFGAGSYDIWLIKTDSNGNEEWSKTFGGSSGEGAKSVQQTADGGYIVAGSIYSSGAGYSDFWLIKTDPNGNLEWDRTFGGSWYEHAYSVQQTSDGGYIVVGYTYSFGAGYSDFWLVKTDSNGNMEWDKTFGGSSSEHAYSVQQTTDGGYIVAGHTHSFGAGHSDFWLVKLKEVEINLVLGQGFGIGSSQNYNIVFTLTQQPVGFGENANYKVFLGWY